MKWNAKEPLVDGEIRVQERFLLLPKCLRNPISGEDEWRWLEFAKWKRKYVVDVWSLGPTAYWKDIVWVNE